MKDKILSICLLSILFVQGCGTIVHGTRQDISINSKPTRAKVSVADLVITMPSSVSLSRDKGYVVTVEKEGYQPVVLVYFCKRLITLAVSFSM